MKTHLELDNRPRLADPVDDHGSVDHDFASTELPEGTLDQVEELQVRESGWEVADKHARIVRVAALRLEEAFSGVEEVVDGPEGLDGRDEGGRRGRRRRRRREGRERREGADEGRRRGRAGPRRCLRRR